jgi:hypothetical protein
MFEAGRKCRRPVGRGNGPVPQYVELIEKQLHVRRNVVGDENQRGIG